MPEVHCRECGENITLDHLTYWDIENEDIKCKNCGAIITITLEGGKLKGSRTREPPTTTR
jgi:ribosomal protein S27E